MYFSFIAPVSCYVSCTTAFPTVEGLALESVLQLQNGNLHAVATCTVHACTCTYILQSSTPNEFAYQIAINQSFPLQEAQGPILESEKRVKDLAMAQAVTEATLKTTKDELAAEKKNHKSLTKSFEEDKALLEAKKKGTCAQCINYIYEQTYKCKYVIVSKNSEFIVQSFDIVR